MAPRANWKSWSIQDFIDLGQLRSVRVPIDHIAKFLMRDVEDVEEKAVVVSSDRTGAPTASCRGLCPRDRGSAQGQPVVRRDLHRAKTVERHQGTPQALTKTQGQDSESDGGRAVDNFV
jgi:hypothetical protein